MTSQRIPCYCCHSERSSYFASENWFRLEKCSDCGLLFINPRPERSEIEAGTESGDFVGRDTIHVEASFRRSKVDAYRGILGDLYGDELRREASWLDIGCGTGEFLLALREFSGGRIRVFGMEPNTRKREMGRERGFDIRNFVISAHEGRYDFVSLLNVFSHLPDPPEFIRKAQALLKPGGELLIETGDTAELPLEEIPRPFELPYEMCFGSERILTEILEKSGLSVLAVRRYPTRPFGRYYRDYRWNAVKLLKEVIKVFLPRKESKIFELAERYRHSRRYVTDMYVRAALPR